jgi:hypothetical protein
VAALIALILAVPAWMLSDDFLSFSVFGDDFAYVGEARDAPTLIGHLMTPHNTHVVPIFRLWTYILTAIAGRLEALPAVLAFASYLALVAAMLAVGGLVARETRQTATALGAMALLGLSSVTFPAITWYSASQALWAGTAIVVTLVLAQSWAEKGGPLRFAAVVLGTLAAPTFWSGGLAAGPAAIAYLAAKKSPRGRRQTILLVGAVAFATIIAALVILVQSRRHIQSTKNVWEQHPDLWPRPIQAVLHTAQALVEACLFGNLGVEALTTPGQAIALLVALAAFHAWSRGEPGRFRPLEAAGVATAVTSGLVEFLFRGNFPYSSLRPLGWYFAIPQVGTVLFLAGWWAALRDVPPKRITRLQLAAIVGWVVLLCAIHVPRERQQLLANAPPFAPNEASAFPTTALRVQRALYYKNEFHERQARALARLDRLGRILSRAGVSPDDLRDAFGRVLVPGIPELQTSTDAFTMLIPRPRNSRAIDALAAQRAEIAELLQPEPEPVPFWLDPSDKVSRAVREVSKQPAPGPAPR